MNKVDIYVNGFRLDIFDDEEISINLSVQNVQDISKVFTDFTQGFTVPATPFNNAVFQHYYRSDIDSSSLTNKTFLSGESLFLSYKFRVLKDGGVVEAGGCCADALDALGGSLIETTTAVTFDARLRQEARIEINSLPFRTGVIEVENVQLKGTEPYAYTMTFYGDVVTLVDLFGEDYLYDLDFSAYDHEYSDEQVLDRMTTDTYAPLFYPLCSPVKNWFYQSENNAGANNENNIAFRDGGGGEGHQGERGIRYFELKPALKVTAILTAMEQKYGITFTGAFLAATPFVDLSLWLHRREGYMYENQPAAMAWEQIEADVDNAPVNDIYNLATNEFSPLISEAYIVTFSAGISGYTEDWEFAVIDTNGDLVVGQITRNGNVSGAILNVLLVAGRSYYFAIRPTSTAVAPLLDYQFSDITASIGGVVGLFIDIEQTSSRVYGNTGVVFVSEQMPKIRVTDFLAGILKMYNMVIVPTTATNFLLEPLDDWYAAGSDKDFQEYLDITEYVVNRPPLYREIEFKYQETEAILGFQYRQTNNIGYGDLNVDFTFDGDEFIVEVPFECPLFERLTDQETGDITNVLCYKSITSEADDEGNFNPYLGAPILFYAEFLIDISPNPIGFVYADGSHEEVLEVWYANTSNRSASAAASHTITFGGDIDPFHLQSVNRSLFNNEYSNYITDLYSKQRRLYNVEAVLPIGKIITLNLQNAIIWNNTKYRINNVSLNMTTGKATFELLNVV